LVKEDWAQAASMMQSLIDDNPADPVMWKQQANCYIQMGDVMRAAENYEVLRLKGIADEASLNTLGDIYSNQEEPLLALGAYLSAIRLSDTVDVDRTLKSAGYLLQLEAPQEAARLMATLRAKAGETLSKDQKVAAFVVESDIADAEKRYENAAELLKQALLVSPASGESRLKLGEMYTKLAEEATDDEKIKALKVEARTAFKQATGDTDPKVGYKANLRLASMLVKAQKYTEALPLIEEAIRLKTGGKESIEQYKRRVERAAARQREREERLEQKRRETREALEKTEEAEAKAGEEKKAKDAKIKEAKEGDGKSGAQDDEKKEGE
jgi:predicted Zn-dependent protease